MTQPSELLQGYQELECTYKTFEGLEKQRIKEANSGKRDNNLFDACHVMASSLLKSYMEFCNEKFTRETFDPIENSEEFMIGQSIGDRIIELTIYCDTMFVLTQLRRRNPEDFYKLFENC